MVADRVGIIRGAEPLSVGLHLPHVVALIAATFIVLAVGVWAFDRRDVATG